LFGADKCQLIVLFSESEKLIVKAGLTPLGEANKFGDFDGAFQSFPIDCLNRRVLTQVVFEDLKAYIPIGIDFNPLDVLIRPLIEGIEIAGEAEAQASKEPRGKVGMWSRTM
jgi:hypothetical protein